MQFGEPANCIDLSVNMQVKLENEIGKKNIKNNRDAVDKLVDQLPILIW